jgi:hypothetical protein
MNILLFILLLNGLLLQPIIAQPIHGVLTRIATSTLTLPPRVLSSLTVPPLAHMTSFNLPSGFKQNMDNIANLKPVTFKVPQELATPSFVNTLSRTASVSESASASTVTVPASTVTVPASTVTVPASTVTVPASTVTVPAPEIPRYVPNSIIVPESSTLILQRIDSGYSQKDEIIKHVNNIGMSVVNDLNCVYRTGPKYNFDINNNGHIRHKGDNFINIKHNGRQIAHLTIYDKPTSVSGHKLSSIHLGVIDGSVHHHYYMVNVDSQDNIIWRKQFPHTPEFSDQVLTVANSISDYFIEKGLNVPK